MYAHCLVNVDSYNCTVELRIQEINYIDKVIDITQRKHYVMCIHLLNEKKKNILAKRWKCIKNSFSTMLYLRFFMCVCVIGLVYKGSRAIVPINWSLMFNILCGTLHIFFVEDLGILRQIPSFNAETSKIVAFLCAKLHISFYFIFYF